MEDTFGYDSSEKRLAAWLSSKGIGGGNDPVGFLIASHEHMSSEIESLKADLRRLLSVALSTCGRNNCNCPGAKAVKDIVSTMAESYQVTANVATRR